MKKEKPKTENKHLMDKPEPKSESKVPSPIRILPVTRFWRGRDGKIHYWIKK